MNFLNQRTYRRVLSVGGALWLSTYAAFSAEKIKVSVPDQSSNLPVLPTTRSTGDRPGATTRELLKGVGSGGDVDVPSFIAPTGVQALDPKTQKLLLEALNKKKNEDNFTPSDNESDREGAKSGDSEFEPSFRDEKDSSNIKDRREGRSGSKENGRDGSRNPPKDRERLQNREGGRERDTKNGPQNLPSLNDSPLAMPSDRLMSNDPSRDKFSMKVEKIRVSDPSDLRGQFDSHRDFELGLGVERRDIEGLTDLKDAGRQQNFRQMLEGAKVEALGDKSSSPNPFGIGASVDRQSQFQNLLKGSQPISTSLLPSGATPVDLLKPPTAGSVFSGGVGLPGSLLPSASSSGGSFLPSALPSSGPGASGFKLQPIVLPLPRRF